MKSRDTRRKFGQNYLKDPAILIQMGGAINPKKSENILEIGPGLGALTNQINLEGVNIVGIDIDEENINYLKKKFHGPAQFYFVKENILKYQLKDTNQRVDGNLPYNISTQIILKLIDNAKNIIDMHFLVQREVAEKISGAVGTKDWGKLAIKIAAFFESQILFDVPPDAFDIKPKVNSSFIRLLPKQNITSNLAIKNNLFKLIDLAFISRRKNIKNNLKSLNVDWSKMNIDPSKRPEELSLSQFISLAKEYSA